MKGNLEPFRSFFRVIGLISAVTLTQLATSQTANSISLPVFSDLPWFTEGDQHGADFSYAVSTAGDVNGDGFDDIIVGAPKYTTEEYKGGTVFVYYGSASGLPDQPDWILGSAQQGSRFGAAVSTAGDVNDDGYDDIIIGAPEYSNVSHEGRIYVVYGSALGLSDTADWFFEGTQVGENVGYAVASAGHVNNDAYADIVIGARRHKQNEFTMGAAFVFYGQDGGLTQTSPDWTAIGKQSGADFGTSVNTAGDVNNDGYDDIIIGAPNYDNEQSNEGAAFLFLGDAAGIDPASDYVWMAEGDEIEARFGTSVNTAGDVNGDNYADVIVGAPHYPGEQADEGGAFVFHGSASGLEGSAAWTAVSGQSMSGFGIAVSTAGDVNQDGFDDVIVGANRYTHEHSKEGAIFVYLGSSTQLQSTRWMAVGNKAETQMGFTVGTAGDITNDGYADVIAGAPEYRQSTDLVGRAFVHFGDDNMFLPHRTYLPVILNIAP